MLKPPKKPPPEATGPTGFKAREVLEELLEVGIAGATAPGGVCHLGVPGGFFGLESWMGVGFSMFISLLTHVYPFLTSDSCWMGVGLFLGLSC